MAHVHPGLTGMTAPDNAPAPAWLTIRQVASLLGVSESTAYAMAARRGGRVTLAEIGARLGRERLRAERNRLLVDVVVHPSPAALERLRVVRDELARCPRPPRAPRFRFG